MTKIVFTASNTLLGKLIRWITKSKVSHVFIEYHSSQWGGQWALEAYITGVRKVPVSRVRHHVVAEFECLNIPSQAFLRIGKLVGEGYDFSGLFLFAWLHIIWKWFGKKMRKPLNATKGQFCSELGARFLDAAGVSDPRLDDPEKASPQILFEVCSAFPEMFKKLPVR